jgi:release factor glutamine methyltransferase
MSSMSPSHAVPPPAVPPSAGSPPAGSPFALLRRAACAELRAVSDTPALDAELLLAAAAGVGRSTVLAYPERALEADAVARFRALVARRAAGEPLAYVLGRREFHSVTLGVGPAVLVPRPETELLVEHALAVCGPRAPRVRRRVLDLGTGSGAIALALKEARPDLMLTAVDKSSEALEVARANGRLLGLDVEWIESDWFGALGGRRFDVIACNPPYVATEDPHFGGPLRFEPRLALDGGPDGLEAIRAVVDAAPRHLERGGWLVLEHGYDQRSDVLDLAAAAGFDPAGAHADLAGRDRCLVLTLAR